jgi:succinate dehydrogenase / fumarate reductase flavoprotein subunit
VPRTPGDDRRGADIPERERWYFLEDRYPKYGNLVPRDIATREIFQVCLDGYGVDGGNAVYLDLLDEVRRIGREAVAKKVGGVLEIYEKFAGIDPLSEPMKIFPALHYTMGGLWTGFRKEEKGGGLAFGDPANMMTNIPGLYAMGEVNFAYHGANRLGANSLLSCIFDGLFGGTCVRNYCTDVGPDGEGVPDAAYDAVVQQEQRRMDRLIQAEGSENPYLLWQEMGREMTANCTVVRDNGRLDRTIANCAEWKGRFGRVRLSDTGLWTNQNLSFARALGDMIVMAEAIAMGARARDESRGAHYKPQFPERDDERFLKATHARHDAGTGQTRIEWGTVDLSNIQPRKRTYGRIEPRADREPPGQPAAPTAARVVAPV